LNEKGDVLIQVSDTGIGIEDKDLNQIFKPFGQVKDILSRSHEGCGLGLSLSKSLAGLHGGSLTLESELGKGITISVTIPANRN